MAMMRISADNPLPIATGSPAAPITESQLNGIWASRFGLFGSPDSETRGGMMVIEGGRVLGGDSQFAIMGECQLTGTELRGSVTVMRHGPNLGYESIFGTIEHSFEIGLCGEEITPDLFELRLLRLGHVDGRMVLRRVAPLPCVSSVARSAGHQ